MCRLAAYSGPTISLEKFLLSPSHGLVSQSWQPKEMREAKLNADGFGIGWFAEHNQPASYINTQPIWSDPNLHSLGRSLHQSKWLATVRSATLTHDVSYANTQPFCGDDFLFAHNGYLHHFRDKWRSLIRRALRTEYENHIHGTTDSEYLFALFAQHYNDNGKDSVEALRILIRFLDDISDGNRALLNIIIVTPNGIVALRHAIRADCPSMYLLQHDDEWGDATLIASEAMTDSNRWQPISENRIVAVDGQQNIGEHLL
jgi:glutamine amidotransferase